MRDLPKNIDADAVIEISRLLDDSSAFVPVRVPEIAASVRKKVTTGMHRLDKVLSRFG